MNELAVVDSVRPARCRLRGISKGASVYAAAIAVGESLTMRSMAKLPTALYIGLKPMLTALPSVPSIIRHSVVPCSNLT